MAGRRAARADLQQERDPAAVVDCVRPHAQVPDVEAEQQVARPRDLIAHRIVAGEESHVRRFACRPGDERGPTAAVDAIARRQSAEHRILAAGDEHGGAAAASPEQQWGAAVAQHETGIVDDRGGAGHPVAWGDHPFVGQGSARSRIDADRARRGDLRLEGSHPGVVERRRAESEQRGRAARDLHGAAVIEPDDGERRILVGHENSDLARLVHGDFRGEREIRPRPEEVGSRERAERAVGGDSQDHGSAARGIAHRDDAGVVDHDRGRRAGADRIGEVEHGGELGAVAPEDDVVVAVGDRIVDGRGECRRARGVHARQGARELGEASPAGVDGHEVVLDGVDGAGERGEHRESGPGGHGDQCAHAGLLGVARPPGQCGVWNDCSEHGRGNVARGRHSSSPPLP